MTIPAEHLERVEQRPQLDPRLGRQLVHDRRSRRHAAPRTGGPRRPVRHRIYDPRPNPSQHVGCCTGVAECVMGNAAGNRVRGTVLRYPTALDIYRFASATDPWEGAWEPVDTGSSGLAAAKGAVQLGIATGYDWYFGLDAVLDGLQQHVISVGTWWTTGMFARHPDTLMVTRTGDSVGGHQYALVAHDPNKGWVEGLCWWGRWCRFRMTEDTLGGLLDDGGDAHTTHRKIV